jgi:hypothetical protein
MIILVNSKITDSRFYNFMRYNLRHDNRFDVAKYCFASFAPLDPLVSKYVFHLDLNEFADRQDEMESWIKTVLPQDKVIIHWQQCNTATEWRVAAQEINSLGDDVIFPATWEDHIFMDSDITKIAEGIDCIKQDPAVNACIMTSHFPECIRYAVAWGGQMLPSGNYAKYTHLDDSGLRIMKLEFFNQQMSRLRDGIRIFRVENFLPYEQSWSTNYQPLKEQFRHFDGYSHVGIGGDTNPPLEIPLDFFTNGMRIRYGFDDYDPSCTNINPTKPLRTVDVNGVDYNFTLDDIPAFWKTHIKSIDVAPNIDKKAFEDARNLNYVSMTQVNFTSAYGVFNDHRSAVPAEWVIESLR